MRRALLLVVLAAACGRHAPAEVDAGPDDTDDTNGMVASPAPPRHAVADAAPVVEIDAEPIRPQDVLSGVQAEQAIAATHAAPTPPDDTLPGDAPALAITTDGVGPYRLGLSRDDTLALAGKHALVAKKKTPAGRPTDETVTVPGAGGLPLLRLRIYAGRLVEVEVVGRDPRAATLDGIMVGSTFDEAIAEYGDPTPQARGWALFDLDGVLFAPAVVGPAPLPARPPVGARIGRIIVVGPEAFHPPD